MILSESFVYLLSLPAQRTAGDLCKRLNRMVVIDFYTRRLLGPKEISDRAAYQPQELDYDYPLVDDRDDIDEHAFDHRNLNEMYPHDDGDTGSEP